MGQGWPGARECERAERVCARARARRGGCPEAAAEAPLWKALAGSEPAWRLPLPVPRGHLAVLPRPPPPVLPSAAGRGPRASLRVRGAACGLEAPRPRGPAQVKVSAAGPPWALEGEGAEQDRACCPWRRARGAARLQHCYLRRPPRPAPRRPAPSRSQAAAVAETRAEAAALADRGQRGARNEERARGAPAAVSASCLAEAGRSLPGSAGSGGGGGTTRARVRLRVSPGSARSVRTRRGTLAASVPRPQRLGPDARSRGRLGAGLGWADLALAAKTFG